MEKTRDRQIELWDAIHAYCRAYGVNPAGLPNDLNAAEDAVCAVETVAFGHGAAYTYDRLRKRIRELEGERLHRVVVRARPGHECTACGRWITRHQAQTRNGDWYHLACLAPASSSPQYGAHGDDASKAGEG